MTQKQMTTISYNSPEFLKVTLDQMCDDGVLEHYFFVEHLPEDDELKKHIHLYIKPNRLVDKVVLKRRFLEPDPDLGMLKPLGIISWQGCSNVDDWILYCRHYYPYLKSKGLERKIEYGMDKFVTNDPATLEYFWTHALTESKWAIEYNVTKDLRNTLNPIDLINTGRIPLAQAGSLVAYERLRTRSNYVEGSLPLV